ncbi:MAG: PspC domain-containing protein [Marinifilaceae bacterium]|jgi:phage shock protein PspC (stress-responsive transcriptional regulator)|nr:PspC domain-containing protein [Marinifilaceae bacterium]
MKKTLTINIRGNVFHIDDDAYEKLKIYLDRLNSHYSKTEEGREIYIDIETRIAEIFIDKKNNELLIITIEMIEELIEKLGRPEDIFEMDDESNFQTEGKDTKSNSKRKLFRSSEQRVFGGVCSGLGAYLGISNILLRIVFAALTIAGFGFPIILYIILWIAIPKAVTAAQKLQMKGERVNISNIERTIKEEYEDVKKNFENLRSKNSHHFSDIFDKIIQFLTVIFRLVLKLVVIVLGIIFIFIGFTSLISFVWSLFFVDTALSISPNIDASVIALSSFFSSKFELNLFSFCASLILAIPLLMLIYAGIKMIFNIKFKSKYIGLSALGAWILAIMISGGIFLKGLNNIKTENKQTEIAAIEDVTAKQVLYLANIDNIGFQSSDVILHYNNLKKIRDENREYIVGMPDIQIEKSYNNKIEIKLIKNANGSDSDKAKMNISNIGYQWDNDNGHLVLDKYFLIHGDQLYRSQAISVVIYLPEGQKIYIDDSMSEIDNFSNYKRSYFHRGDLNKVFVMTESGMLEESEN